MQIPVREPPFANQVAMHVDQHRISVTEEGYSKGVITVPVDYVARRKSDLSKLTLTRPASIKAAKLIADYLASEDLLPVLKACLPEKLSTDDFLNRLSPLSVHALKKSQR